MKLLKLLKSIFSWGSEESGKDTASEEETSVTVEREPDTETEEAVKGVETETEEESIPAEEATVDEEAGEESTPEDEGGVGAEAGTESTPDEPDIEEAPEDETSEDEEESTPQEDVQTIKGIGPAYADRLAEVDIETVEDLQESDVEEISEETGIAAARVEGWMDRANE